MGQNSMQSKGQGAKGEMGKTQGRKGQGEHGARTAKQPEAAQGGPRVPKGAQGS